MNKAFEKILESMKWRLRNSEERYYKYLEDSNLPCTFDKSDIEETRVDTIKEILEIVQEVAEEYHGGWIPCSDRLPDIKAYVLLTLRSLDIYTGFRANTDGYFYVEGTDDGYIPIENVIAWQPLPKPYKERD